MSKVLAVSLAVCLLALPVMVSAGPVADTAPSATPVVKAPAAAVASTDAPASFRWGFDERIREESLDNLPTGVTGKNNYYRFRTRLWAEFDPMENVTLRVRVANEFRKWVDPDKSGVVQSSTYAFPDEFVLDNLSIEVKNLPGKASVKIGRQDIMDLGTGKIFMDGTPEDGSRTYYFDAIRATIKSVPDTTIDVIGIYDPPKDMLSINPPETAASEKSNGRELTGFTAKQDEMTESGGGVYVRNSSVKSMPVEAYGIYKRESKWFDRTATTNASGVYTVKKDWQTGDTVNKCIVNDSSDIETLGVRLVPDFGSGVTGNFEGAYQFGKRGDSDIQAYMFYVGVRYDLPCAQVVKPSVDAYWYYLSGDDPSTPNKDEGWDALWSRYPQNCEGLMYTLSRAKWSNLSMPMGRLTFVPSVFGRELKTTLGAGYLTAPEKDGLGKGTGDVVGWLYQYKTEAVLAKNQWLKNDKLTAHLMLDLIDPGNYYPTTTDNFYFARVEVAYGF
jgi:hypothetical protein